MTTSLQCRSLPNICKERPPIKAAWGGAGAESEDERAGAGGVAGEASLVRLYLQTRGGAGEGGGWAGASTCSDTEIQAYKVRTWPQWAEDW